MNYVYLHFVNSVCLDSFIRFEGVNRSKVTGDNRVEVMDANTKEVVFVIDSPSAAIFWHINHIKGNRSPISREGLDGHVSVIEDIRISSNGKIMEDVYLEQLGAHTRLPITLSLHGRELANITTIPQLTAVIDRLLCVPPLPEGMPEEQLWQIAHSNIICAI